MHTWGQSFHWQGKESTQYPNIKIITLKKNQKHIILYTSNTNTILQ